VKIHRRFSIFGSRALYFALAPWLVVCIPLFPYMALNFGPDAKSIVLSALISALCLVGLLVATDSWRFIRWNIALLILVPVAYVVYFCHTFFVGEMAFMPSMRRSQATPFNAFLGFIVWGIPSLLGARRLLKKARRICAIDRRRRLRQTSAD
jgi:hypothetical protein